MNPPFLLILRSEPCLTLLALAQGFLAKPLEELGIVWRY